MAGDAEGSEFVVGDLDAFLAPFWVASGSDGEPGLGGRRGDQLDDRAVTGEWSATPVHRDEAEHLVFDLVPFPGAGRVMTHNDLKSELVSEMTKLPFPQPGPAGVGSTAICRDHQAGGIRDPLSTHRVHHVRIALTADSRCQRHRQPTPSPRCSSRRKSRTGSPCRGPGQGNYDD